MEAIQSGEANSVRNLIASGIPDEAAELLHYASKSGNVGVVSELLKAGWKNYIEEFDDMSMTPLMWAAVKNQLPVAELLIASGANVNAFDKKQSWEYGNPRGGRLGHTRDGNAPVEGRS